MFLLFGFSIQEFFMCYCYCQKTGFACEFQHTPLRKIILLAILYNFGEYEIFHTCIQFKQEQEYEIWQPIFMSKNHFFGLQNTTVPLMHNRKNFLFDFEHYDLANGKE